MSESLPKPMTADLLLAMAAAAGVALPPDRAAALVAQAEPHFALLRALDPVAKPTTEPAAAFRLDDSDRGRYASNASSNATISPSPCAQGEGLG